MEYQALVPGIVIGIAFLIERSSYRPAPLAAALVGGAIPVALLAHFHWAAFGSPLSTGYAYIENPGFQMMLEEGWMGVTYPRLDRLGQLIASTDCGLLFFSPFLAFGLLLVPLAPVLARAPGWGRERLHLIVWSAIAVLALLLFISANILWRAGWTAGPRYLTALVPFASMLALVGLGEAERIWGFAVRVVAAACFILSVLFSGVSGAIYPHFPVTFRNPIFEVLVPMLRDGFYPENLGYHLLGLEGAAGYVPALVLGLVPCLAWLVVASSPRAGARASLLVTAVLLAALACQPFAALARRTAMPVWGIDDLMGVYTSWQPLDNVSYFEARGCTVGKSVWTLTCPDRVTRGRVQMRLGLKNDASLLYQGKGFHRPPVPLPQGVPALAQPISSTLSRPRE
jgi:hypothetical protein